jgi:hypothetical protein
MYGRFGWVPHPRKMMDSCLSRLFAGRHGDQIYRATATLANDMESLFDSSYKSGGSLISSASSVATK